MSLYRGEGFQKQWVLRWLGARNPFFLESPRYKDTGNAHALGLNGGCGRDVRSGRKRRGEKRPATRGGTTRDAGGDSPQPSVKPRRGSRQKSPATCGGTPMSLAPDHRGGGATVGSRLEEEGRGPPDDGAAGRGNPQRRCVLHHCPNGAKVRSTRSIKPHGSAE